MLTYLIVQLPFSVCAVWLIFVLLKSHKNHSQHLLIWVLAILTITFLCGSSHMSPYPDYHRIVIYDIVMRFTTLAVFPLICFYIRSLFDETGERPVSYLLFLPAILISTSSIVVTSLLGISHSAQLLESIYKATVIPGALDELERYYFVLSFRLYHLFFFILLSLSLVFVFSKLFAGKFKFVHVISFLRGRKNSFAANILCLFFIIFFVLWGICITFGTVFMNPMSPWSTIWAFVTSIVLFLIGYVASVPALPGGYLNMERLRHPFNTVTQTPQEYLQGIDSGPVANNSISGYDKIMDSFKELMVTNQCFLDPTLTIDDIAHKLNSNRTYVSKLVNIYYGMPFRDYLNKLRIDHAKQLIKDEPDAVIDYISAKSGFQSSTQFIRKFKESEGVTPAVWRDNLKK